ADRGRQAEPGDRWQLPAGRGRRGTPGTAGARDHRKVAAATGRMTEEWSDVVAGSPNLSTLVKLAGSVQSAGPEQRRGAGGHRQQQPEEHESPADVTWRLGVADLRADVLVD